jgi:cation transporter-like permease
MSAGPEADGTDVSEGDGDGDGDDRAPDDVETIAGRVPTPPRENRARHAVVWGVVGVLAFGVLHQAYLFLGGEFLGFPAVIATALLVGAVVALASYRMATALARSNEQG